MAAHDVLIRRDTRRHPVSEAAFRRTVSRMLRALGWKRAAVSFWLVGDRRMHSLNLRYFRHDYTTDVISFSQLEGRPLAALKKEKPFLGDIIISLDTAAREAVHYGHSFRYELFFYACHGILHLMGHEDRTPRLRAAMHRRQHAVLKKIGLRPA